MFRYNFRAFDLHSRPVFSLAILADNDASWRPDRFEYELWGSRTSIGFRIIKLLDYIDRLQELEASDNPFAFAVLAHLKTLETRGDAELRLDWKLQYLRMLYGRRRDRREVEELFLFLDWIMGLPEDHEDRFETGLKDLERSKTMAQAMPPLLKRAHERGERIGEQRAFREAVITVMEQRFGKLEADQRAHIETIDDIRYSDK